MDYIQEGSTLPPPLNIVPSPKSILRMFSPFINCMQKVFFKKKRKQRRIRRRTVRFSDPYNVNSLHYDVLNHSAGQVTHKVGQVNIRYCHGVIYSPIWFVFISLYNYILYSLVMYGRILVCLFCHISIF